MEYDILVWAEADFMVVSMISVGFEFWLDHFCFSVRSQSKFHASFAVLGWGLATTGSIGLAPSHLQYFTARFAIFFCSSLLRCDLLAKKVPGRAPFSQHVIIRNWTYMN